MTTNEAKLRGFGAASLLWIAFILAAGAWPGEPIIKFCTTVLEEHNG